MENRRHIVSMSGAHDESKTARHVGDGHKREGALNRERSLQAKMPQRTDLTEMPSHLRDDGGSDTPVTRVSLVSSRSRSRDADPRSLHDKEKAMIESQVRFRLDMYMYLQHNNISLRHDARLRHV